MGSIHRGASESWASASDVELLLAWRQGHREAGNALLERHVRTLSRYLRTRSAEATADLVQKTFLAAVESKERLPGGSLEPFLLGIARNQLRMFKRKSMRAARAMRLEEGAGRTRTPSPSALASAHEQREALASALETLPLEQRELLQLYYWEQLPTRQLASRLGMSESGVRMRLLRARRALKSVLA